ncbi:MAG: hypothetical protein F4039_02040 [Gammaproteobacteria bacterium]|nr:hypothetical protein [Gammaproteobacteria bacterium]MXX95290.1 hypothetical protein [Gammaproteobacteria bacterium]MYK42855.1 hypothetical protein [Gammaproteobacteria bacterium]
MFKALWQDFVEQPWLMKLFLIWGWLAVVIMVGALFSPYLQSLAFVESVQSVFGGGSTSEVPAH